MSLDLPRSLLGNVLKRFVATVRPWAIVLFAILIYLASVLRSSDWNPMGLVRIGTRFDPGLPAGSMGYDGQFAYQIAVSPLESPSKLDVPAYRLQRILYPMLARLLALGNRQAVPWSLVLVNIVSVVGGVAVTERFMESRGRSRWWSIAFGLNAGMLMATRLDLTEPLAFALVQVGVLQWARRRPWLSAAAFCLAALAKEVTVLIILGYLMRSFVERRFRNGLGWGALALGPLLVWQGVLWVWLGRPGLSSGGALSTPFEIIPLHGWWALAGQNFSGFLKISILVLPVVIVPALVMIAVATKSLLSGMSASALALLLQSCVFLFLPTSNLADPLGALRLTIGLIAASLNFGAEAGWRRVLAYSQLWILTLAFVPGDLILPSG